MVGKLAAGGKKRGRPRKKSEGCLPLSPPPAEARRQAPPLPPPPPPPAARRSRRLRRPRRMDDYADYDVDEDDFYYEELFTDEEASREGAEDDEEESEDGQRRRGEKKFKLLQKLPNLQHHCLSLPPAAIAASSSPSSEDDLEVLKKGSSGGPGRGGDGSNDCVDGGGMRSAGSGGGSEEEDGARHAAPESNLSASGRMMDQCPVSTPLPDRKMLEAILEKLQKKDIYRVYAEPVDPEELPDYHDIIKHPMDFGTIRKKLVTGVYCNLEQFESDVFLVCTNAMQYNAPDTIYFRQARTIQELARKKFQSIRFDSEDTLRSEQKTQSNSMTRKFSKRFASKSANDLVVSDTSLVTTCISSGDACGSGHNSEQPCPTGQPVSAEQPVSVNGFLDGSLTCGNKSEKGDEHSAKSSPVELEEKPDLVYEDRRTTYNVSDEQTVIQSDPLFATFENEKQHLVAVGLDAQYSYARSLVRFAGTLGPIAWRIASEKIEKALPAGIKFGPGWVGEFEPLPTPVLFENQSHDPSYSAEFLYKTEYLKKRAKEDEMKYAEPSATKGLQSKRGVPSNSSIKGVGDGKTNHLKELSSCHASLEQSPYYVGFDDGSQPKITNATFLQYKPVDWASARDCKTTIGTNVSSFMGDSVVPIAARRSEWCTRATASRVSEMVSGSRSNKQSEMFKPTELVSYQSEGVCASMGNRGLSRGQRENVGGSSRKSIHSGFKSTSQSRALNYCSDLGGHEQEIGDPIELMRIMPGRKTVDDNPKQLMSTLPLTRVNSVAAVPTAAPAWMSVRRSFNHKAAEASDRHKMQAEAASLGNLSSESQASVSGFLENNKKWPTLLVPQLPSQKVSEECWVQRKVSPVFPQFIATEVSGSHGQTAWLGAPPHVQNQKEDMCPPDLNITFPAPRSPLQQSSGITVDSQQPDLALQL